MPYYDDDNDATVYDLVIDNADDGAYVYVCL